MPIVQQPSLKNFLDLSLSVAVFLSMTELNDGDYASRFLIHWAGRDKTPAERGEILSVIATSRRLLLSDNVFISGLGIKLRQKMVSFTDIPLRLSARHCLRYSDFGIAFHKKMMMAKSAQPVFYSTHVYIRDMDTISRFIVDQAQNPALDPDVLRALQRHIGFLQDFSEGSVESPEAYYFEREWRIGELALVPEGEANKTRWRMENKLPPTVGEIAVEGENAYVKFDDADVAFLVVPRDHAGLLSNPNGFPVRIFEELVNTSTEIQTS